METFIARQPIFDIQQRVYGYELLFRSGVDNFFSNSDPDQATSKVLTDSFSLFNLSSLTGGKRAFINITKDILLKEYVFVVPKDSIVVEILETIPPEEEVIAACQRLKQAGYLLAMDDFVYAESHRALLDLADFIKIDFLNTGKEEREALCTRFKSKRIHFLAEKIETLNSFKEAEEIGYEYFQGYFFSKPTVLSQKDIPGFKLNYLRILQEIHRPEMNLDRLVDFMKQEVSLSYKFLLYINSAYFGLRHDINSIKQALVLLGERETKNWISLLALAGMGGDKPEELAVQAVVRARFCQSLANFSGLGTKGEDLFLLGLLSLIDAFLDRPLLEILREIPVNDQIKKALLGEENPLGIVYQLVLAYERGMWDYVLTICAKLRIEETVPQNLYLGAVEWAQKCFQSAKKG